MFTNFTFMKKIFSIMGFVALIAMQSCTKQYITPGTTNQTVYANVASSDWKPYTDNNGNNSYAVPINVAQIDNDFAHYGGIIVAISYDGGNTYEQLPEVYANGSIAVQPTLPIKVKIILVDSNG
jgi:hypothetical protein